MRRIIGVLAIAVLGSLSGLAQTAANQQQSLSDNSPAENVRAGALSQRAPGTWIQAARKRHDDLVRERLRAGQGNETNPQQPTGGGTTPVTGSTSGLNLTSLISQLTASGGLSSLLGGAGNVSGLLDQLGLGTSGGLTSTGTTVGTGATGTTGTGVRTGTSAGAGTTGTTGRFSNLPPDVIQMLQDAGIDINTLRVNRPPADQPGDVQAVEGDKAGQRAQATTPTQQQEETPFKERLTASLLNTFFTALTVGFQTQDFIDWIKDLLRPILIPQQTGQDAVQETEQTRGRAAGVPLALRGLRGAGC